MAMILTFGFDAASFARLEPLRQRHFPAARNFIPVHVTLFQQLPPDHLPRILVDLAAEGRGPALPFTATGILDFGGGAAIDLECPPAKALQQRLRKSWQEILSDSDDRGRKLHVTVQNKVDRDTARAAQATLRAGFSPWQGLLDRLHLWHYRGGPWEHIATVPLQGDRE
ncbi:2'-5' RNA ligase family protein [Palleronia pelagia]|uniref:2'-5' RNA ligase superfamily protein n=1 Tax=Palleronia pelagia TaxID=387096 RepID=A0A1H8C037_9RHOB|nr:2'-5' RNA ligase family protein [Palleronia pelagia]SEM87457.1 2'-5' RNA ligase superfamily protein [Palleronia pelagia]